MPLLADNVFSPMRRWLYRLCLGVCLGLMACSGNSLGQRFAPNVYTVAAGDTLYSIAWRYQLDHEDLIEWNRIRAPYTIYPGQRLALSPDAALLGQAAPKAKPAVPAPAKVTPKKPAPRPRVTPPSPKSVPSNGVSMPQPGQWLWPTVGKVLREFAADNKAQQGLDITGTYAQAVVASAPGKVVYAGSGLTGYGQLIIVKHNDEFLSAYAHNSQLFVKEGEQVRAGQRIAAMGRDPERQVLLHFEIRRHGKPTNPIWYLQR